MHEYAITESILEIVEEEAIRANSDRVDVVTVAIGELSTFVPDSIEFYFSEMTRGTVAEGADIRFQTLEAHAVCLACGAEFRPPQALCGCPRCGSPLFELQRGQELFVDSIEVA